MWTQVQYETAMEASAARSRWSEVEYGDREELQDLVGSTAIVINKALVTAFFHRSLAPKPKIRV